MANYHTQAVCNPESLPFSAKHFAMYAFLHEGDYASLVEAYSTDEAAEKVIVAFADQLGGTERKELILSWLSLNTPEERQDADILFDDRVSFVWEKDCVTRVINGEPYEMVYLFAEDGFMDVDMYFLQWALQNMPAEVEWISVEIANTCDKMRPDGFGGAAWFITRDDIQIMSTSEWIGTQISTYNKYKEGAKMALFTTKLNEMLLSGDPCWEYDFVNQYRELAQKAATGTPMTQEETALVFPEDEGWRNEGEGWFQLENWDKPTLNEAGEIVDVLNAKDLDDDNGA